jgi:hypothetical protein
MERFMHGASLLPPPPPLWFRSLPGPARSASLARHGTSAPPTSPSPSPCLPPLCPPHSPPPRLPPSAHLPALCPASLPPARPALTPPFLPPRSIFTLAKERDLDLDFHTDENGNELARGLRYVAQKAVQHGYQGRVVCGHCWCVGPCVGWGRGKGDWGAGGKWWLLCERLCVEGRSYSDRNRSCPALSGGCIWPGLCAAPTSPPPRAAPVQPVCHQPPLPPHPAAPSPSSPPTSWPRRWRLRGRRASPLCRCRWSTSGRRTAPTPAAARPAGAASRCCTSCER